MLDAQYRTECFESHTGNGIVSPSTQQHFRISDIFVPQLSLENSLFILFRLFLVFALSLSLTHNVESREKHMSSIPVVTIPYSDLVNFDDGEHHCVLEKIAQAFGSENNSFGILAVTEVPTLHEKRAQLLPLARRVALLPNKEEVISEESKYQTGWSHGKEIFAGKPDTAKGSFYANPLIDDLSTIRQDIPQDIRDNNPGFFAPNVWPTKSIPELEGAFKDLASLVIDVGRLLAKPCDAYVASQQQHLSAGSAAAGSCCEQKNKLTTLLKESKFCKARLLHYFAVDRSNNTSENDFSDWCGWHNDHVSYFRLDDKKTSIFRFQSKVPNSFSPFHSLYAIKGSLTGLIPAMYLDEDGTEVSCDDDDKAGLYVQARNGSIHHVSLPPNAIGFQIGETSQIHSGGILQATPHAVRGSNSVRSLTRESFAVFMEPEYFGEMELPTGKTVENVQDASIVLPSSVKTLSSRWKPGMNFGEFSEATFSAFY